MRQDVVKCTSVEQFLVVLLVLVGSVVYQKVSNDLCPVWHRWSESPLCVRRMVYCVFTALFCLSKHDVGSQSLVVKGVSPAALIWFTRGSFWKY